MPPPKSPRDRDARETIKPPPRVADQIASGRPDRGDATPVGGTPSELNPERSVESRVRLGDLDLLREELRGWVRTDEKQHEEIRETVASLGSDFKASEQQQQKLMLENVKQSLSLNALVEESTISRQKKAELETAKEKAQIADLGHARKLRRGLAYYVARGVIGLAIGAATLAIEHLFK